MDCDDQQVGRILSRREVLSILAGTAGAALLAACAPRPSGAPMLAPTSASTQAPAAAATEAQAVVAKAGLPSCVVKPQQTEGPYFKDEKLNRSDIRSDPSDGTVKQGVPLSLVFNVSQIHDGGCTPLVGAQVDVWHCDALGTYSDFQDPNFGNTVGKKFLRGYQVTDSSGTARFTTIYPGWYQGRTVHIHFKIRTNPSSEQGLEFTSQLYFDDNLTDQVHAQQPYASKGQRTLRNNQDGIFRSGGDQLILQLAKNGQGYATTFDIGMQTS